MELREAGAETDRLLRASGADFDRRLQETDKEIKTLAKNTGGLNNPPGKPLEQMFSAHLWDKFAALGRESIKSGDAKFKENNQIIAEAETDIFFENYVSQDAFAGGRRGRALCVGAVRGIGE
ncbi:MAG: hypothetical protein LBG43_10530 [Treponema sp.]|nr:hypothetical protein [Treponema sp.]